MENNLQRQILRYQTLLDTESFVEAAALLASVAELLFRAGQSQTFLDLLDRLPAPVRDTAPALLIAIGDVWCLRGDLPRAGVYYRQAQQHAQADMDMLALGRALSNQALLCWKRGDITGTVDYYEQAAQVLSPIAHDHPAWEELHSVYALALSSQGRLEEAMGIFQRQIRESQRYANVEGQRMALHNLGIMVYLRQGDFQAAEATLREALQLAQDHHLRYGEAYLSNSLAYTYIWQGRSNEAQALSLRAMSVGEELSASNVIAFAYLNQALAFMQQNQHAAAAHACEQALASLASSLSSPLRCDVLLAQARLQMPSCVAKAAQSARMALAAARVQGDLWLVGQCLVQIGECALELGMLDESEAALVEAGDIFGRYSDRYHLLRWHLVAAQLARSQSCWPAVSQHLHALLADINHYPPLVAATADQLVKLIADVLQQDDEAGARLRMLAVAWGADFAPPASALLKHTAPCVRAWAAAVLAEHVEPWAWDILGRHSDTMPTVRSVIGAALAQAACSPLPALNLTCLGTFSVTRGGVRIPDDDWVSLHAQLVLVYLALHGPATREQLIDLLWPNDNVEKAGARLRSTIRLLRNVLRPAWRPVDHYLVHERVRYQLNPAVTVTSDVCWFQHWIGLARHQDEDARYNFCARALAQYDGEFLPGWYNEWVIRQRDKLTEDWLWAQEEYTVGLLRTGELTWAEEQARRLIRLDPLRERAWCLLIYSLHRQGRSAESVRLYHLLRVQLRDELGVAPSQKTQELLRHIQGDVDNAAYSRAVGE